MGDMSVEPSMEEILSSIKRIIAEEGESPIRGRRVGRAAPPPRTPEDDEAEVLELSHPIDGPARSFATPAAEPEPEHAPEPRPVAPASLPVDAPATAAEPSLPPPVVTPMTAPESADPILSIQAAAASRSALDSLSRLMVKPDPSSDGTLEGMVRDMLRPMLRDWLDANLPAMVETMVQAEIARISSQPR